MTAVNLFTYSHCAAESRSRRAAAVNATYVYGDEDDDGLLGSGSDYVIKILYLNDAPDTPFH